MMAVLQLEDWHESAATIEVVLFPKTWLRFGGLAAEGAVVRINGKVDLSRGDPQIRGEAIHQDLSAVVPDESDTRPQPTALAASPLPVQFDEETGELPHAPEPPPLDYDVMVAPATSGAAAAPLPAVVPQLAAEPVAIAETLPEELANLSFEPETETPPVQRWLKIYFQRSDDPEKDRRRLRRIFGTLTGYPGQDRFTIVVEDRKQAFTMEFPNHSTAFCDDLMRDMLSLVGEGNVAVFDRPDEAT
jgi:hypothetical protein